MSKAREYAKANLPLRTEQNAVEERMRQLRKQFEPLDFQSSDRSFQAYVAEHGGLHCHAGGLDAEEALRFGRWILEVFGGEAS